jgi:glutamate---cysteine ligase / carboxylate-amine ligase
VNEGRGGGSGPGLGVEEELIVVDPTTLALSHHGPEVLAAMDVPDGAGSAHPDTYAALVEFASPSARSPEDGVRASGRWRCPGPR